MATIGSNPKVTEQKIDVTQYTQPLTETKKISKTQKIKILIDVAKKLETTTDDNFEVFAHPDLNAMPLAVLKPKPQNNTENKTESESTKSPKKPGEIAKTNLSWFGDFIFFMITGEKVSEFSPSDQVRIKSLLRPSNDLNKSFDAFYRNDNELSEIANKCWKGENYSIKNVIKDLEKYQKENNLLRKLPEIKIDQSSPETKAEDVVLKGPATLFTLEGPTKGTSIQSPPNWPEIPCAMGCSFEADNIGLMAKQFEACGYPAKILVMRTAEQAQEMAKAFKTPILTVNAEQAQLLGLTKLPQKFDPKFGLNGEFLARTVTVINENNIVQAYLLPDQTKKGEESKQEAGKIVETALATVKTLPNPVLGGVAVMPSPISQPTGRVVPISESEKDAVASLTDQQSTALKPKGP